MNEADKVLIRKIRTNMRHNRFIQSQLDLYRALYLEQPRGEYVKSLSEILMGFGAGTVKDLGGGSLAEAAWTLSRDILGYK